jgi:endonuclease/exonuclease/phosphatase (EEP) superfamily protein YafD
VIINTHILANFAGDWERRGIYARVEEMQLRQLAETVRSQPVDSIIFVAGDFNVPRGSRLYQDFLLHSGLTDLLAGDTRPTLRLPLGAPSRFALPIDYVFVRIPDRQSFDIHCDLCFSDKHWISNRHQGYLSDHLGIETPIRIN